MKKKSFCWLVLITGITFFTSCKKNNVETGNKKSVTLYNCTVKTNEPYICFDSLITDSRCPKEVECIWQGTAIIKIRFHETGNTHSILMSLKGFPGLGYISDTAINGYQIIFTDLKPYPDINVPAPEKIEASFIISH